MASSVCVPEDLFRCPVCYEDFRDPRNLDCGHTFCLECLKNIPISRRKISCPSCRQITHLGVRKDVSNLGRSLLLQNVQHAVHNRKLCEGCASQIDDTNGILCYQCKIIVCERCYENHKQLNTDHTGAFLEEIAFCTTHVRQPLDRKCMDCAVYTCQLCRLGQHKGHTQLTARDLKVRVIENIKRFLMDEPRERITEDDLFKLREALLSKELKESILHLRDTLEAFLEKCDGILTAHKEITTCQISKLNLLEKKISNNAKCFESCSEFIDDSSCTIKDVKSVYESLSTYIRLPEKESFLLCHSKVNLDTIAEQINCLNQVLCLEEKIVIF